MSLLGALRERRAARKAGSRRRAAPAAAEQAGRTQAEAWKKPGGPVDPGFVG